MTLNFRGLFGKFSSDTATTQNITVGNITPITLFVSNPNRLKAVIYNETGTLYIKLGIGASSTSYNYRLTANTFQEITEYTGIITAIKQSGSTSVLTASI